MGKIEMDIGKQIKQVRLAHKLTQEQFGEILGKSVSTIHGYETNTITPPFEGLTTISSLFHISIGDLMRLKSNNFDGISDLYSYYLELVGEEDEKKS